ncbi:MAG: PaaI family thioesterase [Minwuiales bacterium]|nr:PaaI family thioesterase [Minwuiales bacterium]
MAGFTIQDAKSTFESNFAPWVQDLGLVFEEVGKGYVRVRLPFNERLTRSGGILSGQAMMAVADTAMVFCISGQLGGYQNMATVSQTTNFLRPVGNADAICEVRIIKPGRNLVYGEATIFADGSDKPAAHATVTYALAPSG